VSQGLTPFPSRIVPGAVRGQLIVDARGVAAIGRDTVAIVGVTRPSRLGQFATRVVAVIRDRTILQLPELIGWCVQCVKQRRK
jgi:hypothetical protein